MLPRILAVIPCGNRWLHKELVAVLMEMARDRRVQLDSFFPTMMPVEQARNTAIKGFLEDNYTHLMFIDDDTVPQRNPVDLVFLNLDIVGMVYPIRKKSSITSSAYRYLGANQFIPVQTPPRTDNPIMVDAVASGMMVISREVLEVLKNKQPFMRKWDEQGICSMGSDFNFCLKAKEAGFKIWAHFGYRCKHFKESDLGQQFSKPKISMAPVVQQVN